MTQGEAGSTSPPSRPPASATQGKVEKASAAAPAPAGPALPRTGRARTVVPSHLPPAERARLSKEVLDRLKDRFLTENLEISERPGVMARIKFPAQEVVALCTWLRDEGTFAHCAMVAAVDWRDRREVLYHLWSDQLRTYLELTTSIPASDAHIESVSAVWPGASWHEREAWDLMGIRFDHHPDLRRLFLPEGYKFHPLLKTFELHEPEQLEVKARLGR